MNSLSIRPTGELMRYWVKSQSEPGHEHLVDVMELNCPCIDCQVRVKEEKSKPYCIHLERALIQFALEVRKQIIHDQRKSRVIK